MPPDTTKPDIKPGAWDYLDPNTDRFAVVFTTTRQSNDWADCSDRKRRERAISELGRKVRGVLFAAIATDSAVEHITGEVLIRSGTEDPLGDLDPARGNGAGKFYTFMFRRVLKEVARLGRAVPSVELEHPEWVAGRQPTVGETPEGRELLEILKVWIEELPPKQRLALCKRLDREHGRGPKLERRDKVNASHAIASLRKRARREGISVD